MYTEGKLSLIGFDFQEQLLFVCYCVHISHGCVFHYVFFFAYVKRSKKRGLREGKIERESFQVSLVHLVCINLW